MLEFTKPSCIWITDGVKSSYIMSQGPGASGLWCVDVGLGDTKNNFKELLNLLKLRPHDLNMSTQDIATLLRAIGHRVTLC